MRKMPAPAIWGSAALVAGFQLVGSFGAAHSQPHRLPIDGWAIFLLLLGPAALAVRDKWPLVGAAGPLVAADLYLGLGYPYGPIFLSVIVGLFSAVLAGRRRSTWILAGLGLVGYPLAARLGNGPAAPAFGHVLIAAGWLVVVLTIADVVRARRFELKERAQRRTSDERLRIARDLHDVLAHNISLINVQAGVALHLMDERPEQARTALTHIKAASRDALQELRGALDALRYGDERAARAPAPGLAQLDDLVVAVRAGGLDVRTEVDADLALPKPVDLAAYRIVQEALTNVTRHASAHAAIVRIHGGTEVSIEVLDDGRGGPALEGNGIVGMRERAAALGGQVEIGPRPGGGFRVIATLPIAVRT